MLKYLVAICILLCGLLAVSWFESSEPTFAAVLVPQEQATVLFGGDMQFDRAVRTSARTQGEDYVFSCIDQTLSSVDLVVANLEGPITDSVSVSEGSIVASPSNYVFTFPSSTATLLLRHHVGLVNLGNNHIENFGTWGESSTKRYLLGAGVGYFGDPSEASLSIQELHGVGLAFINYNEFAGGGGASTTLSQIATARALGLLPVVYTHWGIEYATTSPMYVRELAHRFVDAGAKLVVGSHPHVVEEHEIYHEVPIFYSLGNFIFDQHFSDAVEHGLLLKAYIGRTGVSRIDELPIVIDQDSRPCLL